LIIEFSSTLRSKGLPIFVTSQEDIDTLVNALSDELKRLNLWQYYVLDITREKASVKTALSQKVVPWDGPDVAEKSIKEIAKILRDSGEIDGLGQYSSRFGVRVDGGVAAGLAKAAFPQHGDDVDALADMWGKVVDVVNVPLYAEWEDDTKVALDNVKNRIKYTRLDKNGPKMGEITKG
jgi:glycogen debranching enzyme